MTGKPSDADEYISVAEARELLRVSKPRMAKLLAEGTLAWEPNPVDRRSKLVKRADVQALARKAGPGKAQAKKASASGKTRDGGT